MPSSPSQKLSPYTLLAWFVFMAWAALVLWASLDPRPFRPVIKILAWDKLQHAGAYALLTLFCGIALRSIRPGKPFQCWIGAALFSGFYGFVVEILQHVATRTRHGDPIDFLADIVGSLLVLAVILPLEKKKSKPL